MATTKVDACAGPAAPYAARWVAGKVLVTNEWGHHARLSEREFEAYARGRLSAEGAIFEELAAKGFLLRYLDVGGLSARWRRRHAFLWQASSLHIVVLTRRCNMSCVYCQASALAPATVPDPRVDMTLETGRTVVARALETPSPSLTIEFQGGEPLANRPALEFIVAHARAEARRAGKDLTLTLVTNLALMDESLLDFLAEHGVLLCTSLDGPADLHDANRVLAGGSSHAVVERWWRRARERGLRVEALVTTTRRSLGRAADIVAEYRRLGAGGIHLRFLNPIGHAARAWETIGYGPREFLRFYREGLEAAIAEHRRGPSFVELIARVFLAKILNGVDLNYMDLRSPCGAGIGQVAYDYDGTVYPCDEARMLRAAGDDAFRLGPAASVGPREAARHPVVRALTQASLLDSQAECSSCAYKPFCGVCPVLEYAAQGDLFGRAHRSMRCQVYKGIQDLLFEKLDDPESRAVLEAWGRPPAPARDAAAAESVYRRN